MRRWRAFASIAAAAAMFFHAVAAGAQPLRVQVYASGFNAPVAFVQDPTDRDVQFVVEQGGRIRVVRSGTVLAPDFLDLRGEISSGGERGLLGLAFAPDYGLTRRFFVNFTNPAGHTVVARFLRSAASAVTADPASRFDLRFAGEPGAFITQPFSNHNGGHLLFGPDGYLYIGLGDGGSGNDPEHHAQTPSSLLGKMLRIDINVANSHAAGYVVPPDNPFLASGLGARPEIWSFGLRNPWRYTFDDPARGGTGAMVIGDVGQNAWEEIDFEPAGRGGRNYGWRNREGAHANVGSRPPAFTPLIEPIHEYPHTVGSSVTGGLVYRGGGLGTRWRGRYFFADFVTSRVFSIALTIGSTGEATASDLVDHTADLGGASQLSNISSFGVDADGEMYLVSYGRGAILRLITNAPPVPTGLRIIRLL
jgi:glucose/arabinose dehydrogenase